MPRPITPALQTQLDAAVTGTGHLLRWNASQVMRWCSWGDITYEGVPWVKYDFRVDGLRFAADKAKSATLRVDNMDNAAAAFFMSEKMADATVDIWLAAPGALAAYDAAHLARLAVDGCEIGLDYMVVSLVESVSQYAFAPRRRIDPINGFNFALPPGSRITWEAENYIVEAEDG